MPNPLGAAERRAMLYRSGRAARRAYLSRVGQKGPRLGAPDARSYFAGRSDEGAEVAYYFAPARARGGLMLKYPFQGQYANPRRRKLASRRNPGGGKTLLPLVLIGGAALLLLTNQGRGMFTSLGLPGIGQVPVYPASQWWYDPTTGTYRQGSVRPSGRAVPVRASAVPATAQGMGLVTQAALAAIPAVTGGIAKWVQSLFQPSPAGFEGVPSSPISFEPTFEGSPSAGFEFPSSPEVAPSPDFLVMEFTLPWSE